ncbi:DUF3224 domain-containing protein [Undibacterium sp. Jales W-56]|uniref:DUF3224 domain-containing protein n=1 Tax=Undibacterium sp. Jales W-56 TaxID=2897325 RepID=UPI0021CEAC24|nr:DUF3224 domain-containing protein [Undibacterium sp. Jales W-56]MCU6434818.1 DUF3224 domain-containing protein [Undibacterium sp. Jales W-56]
MNNKATGNFEVTLPTLSLHHGDAHALMGRRAIEKQFHGDLQGSSQGEMLSAGTEVKGSAAYVAIEFVTASLHGRNGSFALLHSGILTRGAAQLSVTVVPDSGTGELRGLSGTLAINIADGKHYYDFDYRIDPE